MGAAKRSRIGQERWGAPPNLGVIGKELEAEKLQASLVRAWINYALLHNKLKASLKKLKCKYLHQPP